MALWRTEDVGQGYCLRKKCGRLFLGNAIAPELVERPRTLRHEVVRCGIPPARFRPEFFLRLSTCDPDPSASGCMEPDSRPTREAGFPLSHRHRIHHGDRLNLLDEHRLPYEGGHMGRGPHKRKRSELSFLRCRGGFPASRHKLRSEANGFEVLVDAAVRV